MWAVRGRNSVNDLDATLIEARRVVCALPDGVGLGYTVELSCGHAVWSGPLVHAGDYMLCGACLNPLIYQIREIQARQRID